MKRPRIKGYLRGWEVYYDWNDKSWKYADTNDVYDDSRPCKFCGRYPKKDNHDVCLGHLKGVKAACCGHGIKGEAYVLLDDGTRIPERSGTTGKNPEEAQRIFDEWYENYLKENGNA